MSKNLLLIFTIMLFSRCGSNENASDLRAKDSYIYVKIEYDRESEDTVQYSYFDEDSLLLETVGREARTKFIYDHSGRLIEQQTCRVHYCEDPVRKLLVYDSVGNHTGNKYPLKEGGFKVERIKYYDAESRLVREFLKKGQLVTDGSSYEDWKQYEYEGDRVTKEIRIRNEKDTQWVSNYFYSDGRLAQIFHRNNWEFRIEAFVFNDSGRLVSYSKQSSEFPLESNVSHNPHNIQVKYFYDDHNRLSREVRVTHDNEVYFDHRYFYRRGRQSTEKS